MGVCFIYERNESASCNRCIVRALEQILLQPSKAYTVVESYNDPRPHSFVHYQSLKPWGNCVCNAIKGVLDTGVS